MTDPAEQRARLDVVRTLSDGISTLSQEQRTQNAKTLSLDRARDVLVAKLTGETPQGDRLRFTKDRFFGRLFTIDEYEAVRDQVNAAIGQLIGDPGTVGATSTGDTDTSVTGRFGTSSPAREDA